VELYPSPPQPHTPTNTDPCTPLVKQKIMEKRKLRKQLQNTRSPQDKATLNKPIRELKQLLRYEKQQAIQTYLGSLTATEATNYPCGKPPNA